MKRDWQDFKSLHSNLPGARDAFEKACERLFRKIYLKNVQSIAVKHGDGGIDIYIGSLGIEPVEIFQCKFFLSDINESQKQQIRNSFERAIQSDIYKIETWILCIPKVLTFEESIWWNNWKSKKINQYKLKENSIKIMNGNELIDLMKEYSLYDQIFEIEELKTIKSINENVTRLIENFYPNKKELPSILWRTYVGKQRSKNTPIIYGNSIFTGSCGQYWNESDDFDGIYCLDIRNGNIVWFFKTPSDVNEISMINGYIFAGCDDGTIVCLYSITGALKWLSKFENSVVCKILKITTSSYECIIFTDCKGNVTLVDINSSNILGQLKLNTEIISDISYIRYDYKHIILIPTLNGEIYELEVDDFNNLNIMHIYNLSYSDIYSENGISKFEFSSAPLIWKNFLMIGYVRITYYDYPAVVCIDLEQRQIHWIASNKKNIGFNFGNIRTSLSILNDEIIFTHPYSNEIGGININNGNLNWLTTIGRPMYQQWSSPLVFENNIYVARHDGYLYKINGHTKEKVYGIYLGESNNAGIIYDCNQLTSVENEIMAWNLFNGYSIYATPAINTNYLVVGSDEGYLYCIVNY